MFLLLESLTEGLLWIRVFVFKGRHLVKPSVRHLVVQKAGMNMYSTVVIIPSPNLPSPHPAVDPIDII